MSSETRFEAVLPNDKLYLENEETSIEVASIYTIIELISGETYTIEYSDRQASAAWLSTNGENLITFDVRQTILETPYTAEFVERLASFPREELGDTGYPKRTEEFSKHITEIWDEKGSVHDG